MDQTIAAISTAVGEAGIGIVRLSGKDAINIGKEIFKSNRKNFEFENKKLHYGHIVDDKKVLDEVLIAFMKAPNTYTREDMVEIYSHGGIIPVKKILELCLKKGARLAEKGEFTKRAFLNGRLDLTQAEAVIDIIKAKSEKSYEVSLKQLEGSITKEVLEIQDILVKMMAFIEANIDFPEDEIEEISHKELLEDSKKAKERIKRLIDSFERGKILRDGLNTVILGKPNVGKSSLLNAILNENRAIVTDIPGTTRDIIEEYINIDGIPLKLVDTAGIRETEDYVEKIGVLKTKETLSKADLIIALFDVSSPLTEEDKRIMELVKDKKTIIMLNKSDLERKLDESYFKVNFPNARVINSSITTGVGIDELIDTIKDLFYKEDVKIESDVVLNNIRHKNMLLKAYDTLLELEEEILKNEPIDCLEVDIKSAWESLGEITGQSISEDILDKIFSEFCIGK
ncbi:MAG: tRNA uridine-5-carboxymethylaminomethyl(34) synthesis GTPase MnmE [Tissierellales bacterium]|nr:tRNA uridine-5-carboxymethylaminomethyl(34) synthesis GTPase MnmE [Tissierellales bacterium]